jgi:hypothetical protein
LLKDIYETLKNGDNESTIDSNLITKNKYKILYISEENNSSEILKLTNKNPIKNNVYNYLLYKIDQTLLSNLLNDLMSIKISVENYIDKPLIDVTYNNINNMQSFIIDNLVFNSNYSTGEITKYYFDSMIEESVDFVLIDNYDKNFNYEMCLSFLNSVLCKNSIFIFSTRNPQSLALVSKLGSAYVLRNNNLFNLNEITNNFISSMQCNTKDNFELLNLYELVVFNDYVKTNINKFGFYSVGLILTNNNVFISNDFETNKVNVPYLTNEEKMFYEYLLQIINQ